MQGAFSQHSQVFEHFGERPEGVHLRGPDDVQPEGKRRPTSAVLVHSQMEMEQVVRSVVAEANHAVFVGGEVQ